LRRLEEDPSLSGWGSDQFPGMAGSQEVQEGETMIRIDCPHCSGTGKIDYVDYPPSGAEICQATCGVCLGRRKVTPLQAAQYLYRTIVKSVGW
jgi:hypothetical protein